MTPAMLRARKSAAHDGKENAADDVSDAAFDTSVLSGRSTVHGSVRGSDAFFVAGAPLLEDESAAEDEAPSAPSDPEDEPPSGAVGKVDETCGAPAGGSSPSAASPDKSTDKSRDYGGPGELEEELWKNHDEQQALASLSEELRSDHAQTISQLCSTLETTQGQIDCFFSQLPFKCFLRR